MAAAGAQPAQVAQSQVQQELQQRFREFINGDNGEGEYMKRIDEMMELKAARLKVDLADLREFDSDLAERLVREPFSSLAPFEAAAKEAVVDKEPNYFNIISHDKTALRSTVVDRDATIRIGLEGAFGSHDVSPRTLTSTYMTHLVKVEGIVTKCSMVRPKKAFHQREYRDATSLEGAPTGSVYPTKDEEGNPLETEFGLSSYQDHQTLTIQEMPERAPLGQLPRSVDVICDGDLVDTVKPGDRVAVVGIYRALAGNASGGNTSGVFRCVVLCNNVMQLRKQISATAMTPEDVKNIRSVSKRQDIFTLLSRSLAPSIYGHKHIKQALSLLLVGGAEKNLENGTHIRGDINIMMVGDPSTAKSQLLRFVLNIAPLAVNTTGRGSSGVGLTAAVTSDPETGDRRLEAGAMVLADRGVVCIDEFDKMGDADRVAIHEVMEQQTVTIAKAGIQAQLNARCSVVAAANPVYGQYDTTASPQYNVNLPDSLLSRFDLLFIVLDSLDSERDGAVADHVLRMHRYQRAGQEGVPVPLDASPLDEVVADKKEGDDTTAVFQKFNPLLHGGAAAEVAAAGRRGRRGGSSAAAGQVELLNAEFIKKYIHFCKNRKPPQLTDDARNAIATSYNQIRQAQDQARSMPVTARALETLIRLSTAHAKLRLSKSVDESDVESVFEILKFALYDNAQPAARNKKDDADLVGQAEFGDDSDDAGDGDDAPPSARKGTPRGKRSRAQAADSAQDEFALQDTPQRASASKQRRGSRAAAAAGASASEDTEDVMAALAASQGAAPAITARSALFKAAVKAVSALFRESHSSALELEAIREAFAKSSDAQLVAAAGDEGTMGTLVQLMQEQDKLYVSESVAYLV